MRIEIPWLKKLRALVEKKPIVVLRFDEGEWDRLQNSRLGVNEFTVARSHELLKVAKPSTPCLLLGKSDEGLAFGLISSRSPVTTLESRIKIKHGVRILPRSESELFRLLADKSHATNLRKRLDTGESVIMLSPKLSGHLIERLAAIKSNHGGMRTAVESLSSPKHFQTAASLQEDALRTALRAFGLTSKDRAQSLELIKGRETALARVGIWEDSVIEYDARHVPDYDFIESDLTGRAVFERENERLVVITANRRPLERVFGVDLIYLNESRQNIVMLQYKMLEQLQTEEDDDWIYRPDANLDKEIRRMKKFAADHGAGLHEYRLNASVFYLKFVKRNGLISNGGIITPIDHFEKLRSAPACQGPKGGLRISYRSLSGRYLRQSAFLDLIRSGYIGAHAGTTKHLKILVEAVLRNDRAVVAAIQQQTGDRMHDDEDFESL